MRLKCDPKLWEFNEDWKDFFDRWRFEKQRKIEKLENILFPGKRRDTSGLRWGTSKSRHLYDKILVVLGDETDNSLDLYSEPAYWSPFLILLI